MDNHLSAINELFSLVLDFYPFPRHNFVVREGHFWHCPENYRFSGVRLQ